MCVKIEKIKTKSYTEHVSTYRIWNNLRTLSLIYLLNPRLFNLEEYRK